jgi:hypothetical protein
MAPGPGGGGDRQVVRPLLARVLLGGAGVLCAWWDVDLLLRGRPGEALLIGLWVVAALAGTAALLWRPAVVVDDSGVELRNVLRDVFLPWSAIDAIDTRYALTLISDGRRYQSWSATASGRPPRRRSSDVGLPGMPGTTGLPGTPELESARGPASRHPRTASGVAVVLVEEHLRAWQQAARFRETSAPPTSADAADRADRPDVGERGVVVRRRPTLVAIASGAAILAAALTPVLRP